MNISKVIIFLECFNKDIFFPPTCYFNLIIILNRCVFTFPMDLIFLELAKVSITIDKIECSNTVFGVTFKISLVFDPHFFQLLKIFVCKFFIHFWVIIINNSSSIKHFVFPLAMVSYISRSIEECTKAIDLTV